MRFRSTALALQCAHAARHAVSGIGALPQHGPRMAVRSLARHAVGGIGALPQHGPRPPAVKNTFTPAGLVGVGPPAVTHAEDLRGTPCTTRCQQASVQSTDRLGGEMFLSSAVRHC